MESEAASIHVERSTGKPKNTARKTATRSTSSGKGAIKPQHIEQWVTVAFAGVAMAKNNELWMVNRPDVEVRPWAPSAAELLNKISSEQAERVTELSAAATVIWGIGMMVFTRLQAEHTQRLQYQRSRREELNRQEHSTVNGNGASNGATAHRAGMQAAHVAGSGARPASPDEPVFGNQTGLS